MAKTTKKTETTTAEKSAPKTIADVAAGFLAHMKEKGSTDATVASYAADLAILLKKFGTGMHADYMTADVASAYYDCDEVTKKKNGKPRHKITIAKIRRVFRMAMEWAVSQGWIEAIEFPKVAREAAAVETPVAESVPAAGEPTPTEPTVDATPELPSFTHPELAPEPESPAEAAPKKKAGRKAMAS